MIDVLEFDLTNEYVYCRILSEQSLDDRLSDIQTVKEYCDGYSTTKLMIDLRYIESDFGFKDSYAFLRKLRQTFNGFDFAVYYKKELPILKIISMLSLESGKTRIKLFYNFDEAKDWLIGLK